MTSAGVVLAALGAFLWMVGALVTLGIYLGLVFSRHKEGHEEAWILAFGVFGGAVILQAVGSAMVFFCESDAVANPLPVPTQLLPAWWFARFMKRLVVILGIPAACGFLKYGFQLDPSALSHGLLLAASIFGHRHFSHRVEELTPPYPPSRKPRPIHRGTSLEPPNEGDSDDPA
ncbi:hypothetical protein [Luteolibacter sp. LG18]|uniref:hypothetical protein n=1 Tax=Luteolibacter sp. LG18 TaxID=2819286 RepID=UPI0030C6E5AB